MFVICHDIIIVLFCISLVYEIKQYIMYLYHTDINIWYTCNKESGNTNIIRILKLINENKHLYNIMNYTIHLTSC